MKINVQELIFEAEQRGGFYQYELKKEEINALKKHLAGLEKKNSAYLKKNPKTFLTPYDEEITIINDLCLPEYKMR